MKTNELENGSADKPNYANGIHRCRFVTVLMGDRSVGYFRSLLARMVGKCAVRQCWSTFLLALAPDAGVNSVLDINGQAGDGPDCGMMLPAMTKAYDRF